jgi:hypothetical protein
MLPIRKFLFKPYTCTDFDIFFRYNRNLHLPRCFRRLKGVQKRCRCFKELEVLYNPDNPLVYVCRMIKVLKDFRREFQKHENLAMILADRKFGFTETSNVTSLIKYHAQTLEYFGAFLKEHHEALKLELHPQSSIKPAHFRRVSKTVDFVSNQVAKCVSQLEQTFPHKEPSTPKIYQDLVLLSHLHSLQIFKRFILSCWV